MSLILFFKSHVGAYLRGGKMVNVAGYQGKTARGTPAAGQRSLFDEPQHAEPTKDMVAEHDHLVGVLRSPSHADGKVEAGKQAGELKEYKQEANADKKPTNFSDATSAPSEPGVYRLEDGMFARFYHGIWWSRQATPKKALLTEQASTGSMAPKDRNEGDAWVLHAKISKRDPFGEASGMRVVPMAKSIIFLTPPR